MGSSKSRMEMRLPDVSDLLPSTYWPAGRTRFPATKLNGIVACTADCACALETTNKNEKEIKTERRTFITPSSYGYATQRVRTTGWRLAFALRVANLFMSLTTRV